MLVRILYLQIRCVTQLACSLTIAYTEDVLTGLLLYKLVMQSGPPNRLGLGLRAPLPSYGQGPSMQALAQQQQQMHTQTFVPPQTQKMVNLFIGSISGGITDAFLNELLSVRVFACHILLFLSLSSLRSAMTEVGAGWLDGWSSLPKGWMVGWLRCVESPSCDPIHISLNIHSAGS